MAEWNREIRLQECIFDATTVVYGAGSCALAKQDWWPQDEDSRNVFQEIRKIAEFYEEHYPEDDEDYLENIAELTTAWFKSHCGLFLTDCEELYLCNTQRVADYVRKHSDSLSLIDYDSWTTIEEVTGEEITYEEYHAIDQSLDTYALEYGEGMREVWLKQLTDLRKEHKTMKKFRKMIVLDCAMFVDVVAEDDDRAEEMVYEFIDTDNFFTEVRRCCEFANPQVFEWHEEAEIETDETEERVTAVEG